MKDTVPHSTVVDGYKKKVGVGGPMTRRAPPTSQQERHMQKKRMK